MAEAASRNGRWLHRAAFALIAAAVLFLRLLPIDTMPGGLPGPDVMACLTLAWALRRSADRVAPARFQG